MALGRAEVNIPVGPTKGVGPRKARRRRNRVDPTVTKAGIEVV